MAGYGVAWWLGRPEHVSLLDTWPGRILAVFFIVWWSAAFAHFRQMLKLSVPGEAGEATVGVSSHGLAQLHSHYWRWLFAYVALASLLYAAEESPLLAVPTLSLGWWAQIALVQLLLAALVGMPFYLRGLSVLNGFVAVMGVERVQISLERKLLLFGVLVPLLAGIALMYFYWWRTHLWTPEILLVWGGLGLLVLASVTIGVHNLFTAMRPLQTLIAKNGATLRLKDLAALQPASTDELGVITHALLRLGRFLSGEEMKLQAIIRAAPDGIVVTDEAGRIEIFNPAAERLFGVQSMKARGMLLCKLLPTLACDENVPCPLEGEQEVQGRHSDGSTFPLLVHASKAPLGDRISYVCLMKDISLRTEAKMRLQEAESRYRDLVESSRDLIWSIDKDKRWTFVNSAAKHIYGVDPAEMIGCSVHEFTEPEYKAREQAAFNALWDGRDWLSFESVHRNRDGSLHHLNFIARGRKDKHGRVMAINGIARDVTEYKMYERKLAYQASHDALTGLFNRNYLRQELERMLARVARGSSGGVLMFLDLDQLKFINDTLGHGVGDRLLVEAARLMKDHVREGDLLARYGGDEFTVLLYNTDAQGARTVAENLRARFGEFQFLEGGNAYSLTCSIGLAAIDDSVKSADECLSRAERACNNAKTLGRNQVVFHAELEKEQASIQDVAWIDRIKELMEEERFQLVYQPIMAIATGSIYDYEVLVRMVEREGHLLMPGAFMPTAERLGLIRQLDRCVVPKAIQQLAELRGAGRSVRFSINLSSPAMRDEVLLQSIGDVLAETKLDPSVLTFEIKETVAVADLVAAADFIRAVKGMGLRVVLEQFGLGVSSFTYLKHLPVDALKIDGCYVQGLSHSVVNQVVVRSINQVAHALGKVTIAPQVENKEVLTLLRDLGVDYAQGYFVGRPELSIGADRYLPSTLH